MTVTIGNRARGELRASFVRRGARTRVHECYEARGLRLRFPKVVPSGGPDCEAVCINTAGGMVGGDRADLAFRCQDGARVTITTQSAEKIYRAETDGTAVAVSLQLGAGAELEWLPQETILFDRVQLRRRLEADLAADSSLLMVETLVFGRLAMGEQVTTGTLHDRWRVRRAGRLVFADDLRLDGPIAALLDRPALGAGARATATLLLVAPDAERHLEAIRQQPIPEGVEAGASAWNGMLAVRALAPSPDRLRAFMLRALAVVRGGGAPRVWQ